MTVRAGAGAAASGLDPEQVVEQGRIDDTVLRQVTRLDIEEVRLSRRELVD